MNEFKKARNRVLAERVIKGLESRNITGYYAETKEEALKKALELIPVGTSVGWGGSKSIEEIGLKEALSSGDYRVYSRDAAVTPDEKRAIERQILFDCDYFLCSSNAVTEDGILVNIDGNANRVAAIAFGPRHVLMIVGMNKIAKDEEAALSRARNEVAPIIGQVWKAELPCKKTGTCVNCKSKNTVCCQVLTTRFSRVDGRIQIILVNDDLGF